MAAKKIKKIGVLAVQGGVVEHVNILKTVEGVEPVLVRYVSDLAGLCGIILPGGESTAIGRILMRTGLGEALQAAIKEGLAVFGTCAGMILLSKPKHSSVLGSLGVMDLEVERNAFGRQMDSFDHLGIIESISPEPLKMRFVRAPRIKAIYSESVKVLYAYEGHPVAVQQGKHLALAFHPELVGESKFHEYFVNNLTKAFTSD